MNLLQILKLPLSLLQVFSSTKSFVDNPILGSLKLNEWGLHRSRCAIAARMATWRRKRLADRLDSADLEAFDKAGIVIKPDFLPAETFEQLRKEVLEQSWETLEMQQGLSITRRIPFDLGTLAKRAPTLAQFVNDKVVADVSGFHGRTPSPSPTLRFEVHAALRRNPFLPWLGLHVWNLPLLNSHLGTIERMVCHLVERHNLRKFGFRGFWPLSGYKKINAPFNSMD